MENMSSDCLVTYVTFNSSCDAKGYPGGMTPQGRLERLKQTLKSKIQQMEDNDEAILELESHLRRAKEDLARLKEKCDGKDRTHQSIELAKYEDKLREFKELLLGATAHLEKVLRNMVVSHDCNKCKCQRLAGEEGHAIHCIRKDLESLQIKKSDPTVMCDSGIQTEDKRERRGIKKSLNVTDMENFRDKSVAGMNALEEMKDQVDVLYGLVKNYFEQMPSDYEKCQLEECENKFQKLHEEFDGITETLSALLESLNSTRSDKSDGSCSGRKRSISEAKSDKIATLQSEQKQLEKEICEKRTELERIRSELTEAEMVLHEKKCQCEEQDKDLRSREEEIGKLRAGMKGFRERLREMQIEIAEEVNNTMLATSEDSMSSISVLSSELQELCEILTSSRSSFPGIVEKCREENHRMKSTITCLEKCLENKEQTSAILQKTLKLRDGQIDDLNCRIQSLESHIEKLNQEMCEKTRLIGNLQDSMRKAKEFEMKIKDECIASLQIEVCELDARLKAMLKEVVEKRKEVEVLQDEILYVSSKNFFLNREIDLLEPKLGKMQKNLIVYERMVCELQKELSSRKCEIEELYEKVRELEQELECETKRCEEQTLNDTERINELNATIRELKNELECADSGSRKSSPVRSLRRSSECDENEDPCKKPDPKEVICQLRAEIKTLKHRLKQYGKQEEIKSKIGRFEEVIKQAECRQQGYNDKMNELQKILEETVAIHECEKEKLMQKLRKEEMENTKNKAFICKLNESIKCKTAAENALKEALRTLKCELDNVKSENECLKSTLENMKQGVKDNRDELDREELDKLINDLEMQKTDLKARCCALKSELDKEEKIKKSLENRIDELNDMLTKKTLQFKQLSQNYKCTSTEAQEALAKLKDAEVRLKCMKMAVNRNECEFRDPNNGENEDDSMQRECLEDSLVAKTVECNNLMSEVECLQEKLKTVQNNYISAQANKDCELSRMSREVCRLESELDLAEKENCKLRNDVKVLHDDVKNLSKRVECSRNEIDIKNKEISDLTCEKNGLLESVDELQKRLEEFCVDSTAKEKENRELREQSARMRKQINEMENEMCEMRQDFESLRQESSQTAEQLRCCGRKMGNLKKLYKRATEESANLEETRCGMEKELTQLKNENAILKQKIQCMKKQKEIETRKLMAEYEHAEEENMRISTLIQDLNCKMITLEEQVIPELKEAMMRKDRIIENFKMELCDANTSSQRMREESLRVIQATKKYLAAQKNANEASRAKSSCPKDNRYGGSNENRDLEEQLTSVSCMTDKLYFELQNNKNTYQDAEPRSFSPLPWGCSNVERDNSSPDYGFQSLQPSPTDMNYFDYGQDTKRSPSQWNNSLPRQMDNQYSSCRNPSGR